MNDNRSEISKGFDKGEELAAQFTFLLQQDYFKELSRLGEMIDNGASIDVLKDRIDSFVENEEDSYRKMSDIYYDMDFDRGNYEGCKTFHQVMVKFIRDRACKLNAVADEMEREYNGGMTDREIDDLCREEVERHALNGLTLQEAADRLAQVLNNGYSYTSIMNTIKELLEFKFGLTDIDPDRYEEDFGLTHEDCLLLDLRCAGVDVDKVNEYLSTAIKNKYLVTRKF